MILLLVFYFNSVATFSNQNQDLSRNVTIDIINDAYHWKSVDESFKIHMDPLDDASELPALRRARRQKNKKTTLSAQDAAKRNERIKQNVMKNKALTLMQQAMYQAQELIVPLEPIFKKYEKDTSYRMAFVFLKLHTLMVEAKSILKVLETRNMNKMQWSATQRVQVYWQLMRRNMDVTYLVDYINERVTLGTEGLDAHLTSTTPAHDANQTSSNTSETSSSTTARADSDNEQE